MSGDEVLQQRIRDLEHDLTVNIGAERHRLSSEIADRRGFIEKLPAGRKAAHRAVELEHDQREAHWRGEIADREAALRDLDVAAGPVEAQLAKYRAALEAVT